MCFLKEHLSIALVRKVKKKRVLSCHFSTLLSLIVQGSYSTGDPSQGQKEQESADKKGMDGQAAGAEQDGNRSNQDTKTDESGWSKFSSSFKVRAHHSLLSSSSVILVFKCT